MYGQLPDLVLIQLDLRPATPLPYRKHHSCFQPFFQNTDIGYWWNLFGPMFASDFREKRVRQVRAYSKWKWHIDEIFVKTIGKQHDLWRAVDHEGEVLESIMTTRKNKRAALKFPRKRMKRNDRVEEIVPDRLPSCGAALKYLGSTKKITGRWLNNQVESSHLPF